MLCAKGRNIDEQGFDENLASVRFPPIADISPLATFGR
jgi:hypothetical protein